MDNEGLKEGTPGKRAKKGRGAGVGASSAGHLLEGGPGAFPEAVASATAGDPSHAPSTAGTSLEGGPKKTPSPEARSSEERALLEGGFLSETRQSPKAGSSDDCATSNEALAGFAATARELRLKRRNPSPVVALRIKPDILLKYKSLGKGYTSIMSDVLNYVAENPEILAKASTAGQE